MDFQGESIPLIAPGLFFRRAGWIGLVILLLSTSLMTPELASMLYLGVAILCALLTHQGSRIVLQGFRRVSLFIIIPLIGALQAYRHNSGDVLKDIWYFVLPVLTLMTGWLFAPMLRNPFRSRLIMMASLLSAAWYLIHLATVFGKISIDEQYHFRQEAGTVDFLVVWGFLIALDLFLLFRTLKNKDRSLVASVLVVNLIAIVLSFSRTAYGIIGFAVLLVWIPLALKKRRRLYWGAMAGVITVGILGLGSIETTAGDDHTLYARMRNSIQEVSTSEFNSMRDINTRYRGFEAYQAMTTYWEGNLFQLMIGQGLGSMVDLGTEITLVHGEPPFRYIPILHNGYMYLLVKTGLLGLLVFLVQIRLLWRRIPPPQEKSREAWSAVRLGRGILMTMLFSTFVIAGPYNKGGWFSAMLILGMVLRDAYHTQEKIPAKIKVVA